MCNLRVKHKVTKYVELVGKGRLILTEIVKDLHNLLRLHNLFETMLKRVQSQKIE